MNLPTANREQNLKPSSFLSGFKSEGVGVLGIVILLVIMLSLSSPYFLTKENISNLLLQSVFIMIVALGMTFVLSMGGIDLSVGSVLGLSGGITGWLMIQGANMWLKTMSSTL